MSANKARWWHNGHNLLAFAISFIAGILIFKRDWLVAFSGDAFFSDDYYTIYFHAYLLAVVTAFLVTLITNGSSLVAWFALMLPSFSLRHTLFLEQIGPTNTWPPALIADMVVSAAILVPCVLGRFCHPKIFRKHVTSGK
jgi:hypothetical protein